MEKTIKINDSIKIEISITKQDEDYGIYIISIVNNTNSIFNTCETVVFNDEYDFKQTLRLLSFIYNCNIEI